MMTVRDAKMTSRLSESDVRSAIDVALETTAIGDGRDERQELNFTLLTKTLNDLLEQNEEPSQEDIYKQSAEIARDYLRQKEKP